MLCPSCGHENPPEASFCMRCGARLGCVCAQCGRANLPEAAYCISCGHRLAEAAPPTPSPTPSPAPPTSFAAGRYRVQRFLGEGGKKRVYLAHDTRLDRDVAFSLIKTERLGRTGMATV